jgi:large subunit ribosomal protein L17
MRHRSGYKKLGRSSAHRSAMLAAVVCSLIEEKRVTTTLTKAKEARRLAERMVTLGRKGTLAARRQALATLHRETPVSALFDDISPRFEGRNGGYTRVVKLRRRSSDSSEMAILEWVDMEIPDKKKKKQAEEAPAEEAS